MGTIFASSSSRWIRRSLVKFYQMFCHVVVSRNCNIATSCSMYLLKSLVRTYMPPPLPPPPDDAQPRHQSAQQSLWPIQLEYQRKKVFTSSSEWSLDEFRCLAPEKKTESESVCHRCIPHMQSGYVSKSWFPLSKKIQPSQRSPF